MDANGGVWIGTDRDVAVYHEGQMAPLLAEPVGVSVNTLHSDERGGVWIGTAGRGLLRFEGGALRPVSDALSNVSVTDLYAAPDEALWVATPSLVFRIHGDSTEAIPIPPSWNASFVEHEDPTVPLVAGPRPLQFREGRFQPLVLDVPTSGSGSEGLRGPGGESWLSWGATLFRGRQPILEAGWNIRGLVVDHEGSLWIAAMGLHRLKPALFNVYGTVEGGVDNVYPIHEDEDGTLWFGSFGSGLARFAGGRFEVFKLPHGIPGDLVLAIHRDRGGDLWIGAYNGSMCRFREGLPCERPPALRGRVVRAIHHDRRGSLWVGTESGLFVRSSEGAWSRAAAAEAMTPRTVRVILEAPDGTLWFGTNGGGLLRYRPAVGFERFTAAQGLSSDLIRSIHRDATGIMWIGTEGRGLNRLELGDRGNFDGASVTVYRQRDGLYEEVIHQVLEDDFGRLWMSSNRGVFWVDRGELEAFARGEIEQIHSTHYTERDGLRNREANGGVNGAGVKARDGRLWFPTQAGVAVVDPANIRRNTVPPPVVIEGLSTEDTALHVTDGITLPVGARDFAITYSALSFVAPENVRFRYRLVGFDDHWIEATNRRTAFYTNVPAGRYRFHVIASNNDGVWNEVGATLQLGVARFFYETWWFRGVSLMALLGTVVGTIGLRLRGIRRRERDLVDLVGDRTKALREEKEAAEAARRQADQHRQVAEQALATIEAQAVKLQELDESKSRFFANVSHEFRTPLTLMLGPLEDLRTGLHGTIPSNVDREITLALRNARRLLHLVDQLLDVARLEDNRVRVRARRGDVVSFLRGLLVAFSPLADRKRIAVRFEAPEDPCIAYYDPDLMEQVIANLLTNAFKYTPDGGVVRISMRATVPLAGHPDFADMPEGNVTLEVKDSGPGIPADDLPCVFERFYRVDATQEAHPGAGIGLSLARELVELHGGRIEVESEEGFGAAFTVTLPLGKTHLATSQLAEGDARGGPSVPTPAGTPTHIERALLDDDLADSRVEQEDPVLDDDRPTVVVIDDNAELRAYIRKHLGAVYRVIEAATGSDGLRVARDIVPDCVISDIMMPGLDGRALCRAVRSDPDLDFVPVILLTARAGREDKLEGLAEGADDYLAKPFDVAELVARVQNLITSRERLRRHSPVGAELHPAPIEVASSDEVFLERVRKALEHHLDDTDFGVDAFARVVGQSRSQLYRRLQELLGESPSDVIQRFRLERSAGLLAGKAGTVSEIAYGVGFKSVSHFCRRFRARYGMSPAGYADAASRGEART
jgi:signal transduction histidine kinase/DNA-binding response OmpR family regulator